MQTAGDRLNAWRKALGALDSVESRIEAFENAAADISSYLARGLEKPVAADWLHDLATAHGLYEVYDADDIQAIIADAIARGDELERVPDITPSYSDSGQPIERPVNGKANGKHLPEFVEPTAYVLPDAKDIPPRAWLFATHYMRGAVTATVAPGGFGKTTLALFEILHMVDQGYRAWYISGEDDKVELDRRIAAHCQRHSPDSFGDRLFVDDKISFPFKIAKTGRNGPEFDDKRLLAFEQAIERRHIDIVTIDPFVSFHLLSENDTAAMDGLVKRLGEICVRCQCSIEISHHVRKPSMGQLELSVYDARGAAAIVNAVRSCRVLNIMNSVEAQQIKQELEDRSKFLRIDSGKRNMAPPEKAKWLKLVSIAIGNGDWVQALEPFEFKPQEATEADEMWVIQTLAQNPNFRADSRSPEWFGVAVAAHFNRGHDERGDVIWINKQIKKWSTPDPPRRQRPLIRKVPREDEHRKERLFFELCSFGHESAAADAS